MINFSYILKLFKQFSSFIKYCLVGVIGTILDVISLYILIEYFKIPLLIATTFSFLLAVTNNFVLNKLWTFKNNSKNYKKLYIKFLLVSCVGLILTNVSMYLQVIVLQIWYVFAKVITSGIVLTWNFLANKYWTFKIKKRNISIPEKFIFDLSIIIPAFNEQLRIKSTLLNIYDYLDEKKIIAEVIVVDDGSTDRTLEILQSKKKKFRHLTIIPLEKNQGKGYAVKKGVEKTRGELMLITDADNSTPIEEAEKLIDAIRKGYDIVIGSRYMNNSSVIVSQSFLRVVIGRIGNILIRIFLINNIKDTQCGFKLFKHVVAKNIFLRQKVKRWGFDMEALTIAQMFDYKIKEVPVNWFNSSDSRVRPIRDALKTFIELIYIKLNMMSGRYKD